MTGHTRRVNRIAYFRFGTPLDVQYTLRDWSESTFRPSMERIPKYFHSRVFLAPIKVISLNSFAQP